jgi:ATP-dependent protease Clp ATPase subunit
MADAATVVCSFCGQTKEQAAVMIGVPAPHFICDQCVPRAHAVIADPGQRASTPIGTIEQAAGAAGTLPCCFCGQSRDRAGAMASAGHTRICGQCLDLCDEILSEVPPPPSR